MSAGSSASMPCPVCDQVSVTPNTRPNDWATDEMSDGNSTDTELYNLDIDQFISEEQNKNTVRKTEI